MRKRERDREREMVREREGGGDEQEMFRFLKSLNVVILCHATFTTGGGTFGKDLLEKALAHIDVHLSCLHRQPLI